MRNRLFQTFFYGLFFSKIGVSLRSSVYTQQDLQQDAVDCATQVTALCRFLSFSHLIFTTKKQICEADISV
jgi:hypothetical protein